MTHRERDILQAAHDAGVTLTVDGGQLRYRAPAGAMTPDLRADLQGIKADLLCEYHERAGILEYDARLPRAEANTRAGDMVTAGEEKGARYFWEPEKRRGYLHVETSRVEVSKTTPTATKGGLKA